MKVTKALSLLLVAFACSFFAKAQDHEVGLFLGTANYQGDLTQKHITLKETKPAFGLLYRYYFSPRLNFRANANLGWIEGDDQNYADIMPRQRRNLSFRSHVAEFAAGLELNILPYVSGSQRYKWTPYVYGGVAVFNFKPKTEYSGQMWDLNALGTEGQTIDPNKTKYGLTQISIPYGAGVKFSVGKLWNIGLEVGQRKLFTDYLDDVSSEYPDIDALTAHNPTAGALSDRRQELGFPHATPGNQRGNPNKMDMYVFGGLTITKTIRRFSCAGF